MRIFGRSLDAELCIIAEIGVNHEGNVDKAVEMIELAAGAGAHAVKFQSYTTRYFVAADDAERRVRVEKFRLTEADHGRLAREAERVGVGFFSTPVSHDMVPMLDRLVPAFKIMSGDLTFEPTIRAVAQTGKPILLSTGLGTVEEIDQALEWIGEEIGPDEIPGRVVVMHCVSAYPTPIDQANLLSIPFLAERYGVIPGYSNHVIGLEAPLAAVALGARVIELHFTDQKEGRVFRDHALSFDADDMSTFVRMAPMIAEARGRVGKRRAPCETDALAGTRKGIVAARDLAAGEVLTAEDLIYARPATQFPATELASVIGRTLARPVAGDHLLPRDALVPDTTTP